jgi:hypothetical protein
MPTDDQNKSHRRSWGMDPSTRVRPSKPPYNRGKQREILDDAVEEVVVEYLEEEAAQEAEIRDMMEDLEDMDREIFADFGDESNEDDCS